MSSIEKSNNTNLVGNISYPDFGSDELNNLFKSLDSETQGKITKYSNKSVQINILKSMLDPELTSFYNSLNSIDKQIYDAVGLRDKYLLLKKALQEHKKNKENAPIKTLPILPGFTPPDKDDSNLFRQETQSKNYKEPPKEIFEGLDEEEYETHKQVKTNDSSTLLQQKFDDLVRLFYGANPFIKNSLSDPEFEVRFGTRGIKPLTKNDYDNVIKKLKSLGFTSNNSVGEYYLRANCEFLDNTTGRFKMSDIRAEISGLHNIQSLCENNDLKQLYNANFSCVSFIKKVPPVINKQKVFPINFDDFNFRVSYVKEDKVNTGIQNFILENFKKSKKEFRFINRVTFAHKDLPFNVDISIVKYGNKAPDKYGRLGRGRIIPVYTIEESNVFNNEETYEIEIEINGVKLGPTTNFTDPKVIADSLRKVIKYVLCGLQGTNYPISYPEQKEVLESYMRTIWKDEFDSSKRIDNKYFIGPNSITLQTVNIADIDDNSSDPNIRKDFVVTDKADGDRHLMFVNAIGKIYLINTNMDVIFTGAKTHNDDCFNTLIDGELIIHDKNGRFINLYAAFDIYYHKKNDVRQLTFMLYDQEKDPLKSRYALLKKFINELNPLSIMDNNKKPASTLKNILSNYKESNGLLSPMRFSCKEFYPFSKKQTIFSGCNEILSRARENRFEYETDGLIFTHSYFGVGSDKIGQAGPKTKITWEKSFKWKPPKYNTIDFLITTEKTANGEDVIKPIFEDGISCNLSTQLTEYKIISLRCGFNEKKDGYINPCQDIIDDKLPQFVQRNEDNYSNDYVPIKFTPTSPYMPNASVCKIKLRLDDSGVKQMFSEENEVFTDNTIVEFSYDLTADEGWRWIPLRVRHDKTSEYRRGQKQFGNSFKTANENWKSIHNPITEQMICTGIGIPNVNIDEDIYYNKPAGKMKTEAMKNFHNLYVKKMLISSVSKPGDNLIDYACGKAGDLPKWIGARLSFVFGIDYSNDNLTNRLDGACARFLNSRKTNKNMPYALFVNGNSSYNIKNGSAMLNDKAKQITQSVFGIGTKDPEKIGKGVARQYGVADSGFNVSSCQFAMHYFLENPDTLQGFMRNLAECTKLNGYFIGTAYDGKLIFNMLKKVKTGESVQIIEDGKKIWEVIKNYGADSFEDNSSSIGYKIGVFQESINQTITEYLINFDYFDRVMYDYGFKIISEDEAKDLGLTSGTGLFSELFINMLEEIKRNKYKEKDYGKSINMSEFEKKISFLNRFFVYKKIREVNAVNIAIEMSEYSESEMLRSNKDTQHAVEIAKQEEHTLKPKVRKLTKKLLLVQATEAYDDVNKIDVPVKPSKIVKPSENKKTKPKKKLLIIEDDEE
uniref:mRNA (guanine-N(7))-methyltransferase n=1 Tax=viral metagenome TaxID=1070528 RepID=A0A6C0EQ15_9ZZZZ